MNSKSRSPALSAAVDAAYGVFARHAVPPFPLDVCLACCVSPEVEQQLREWPLARVSAQLLYEYNNSAKSELQSPREVGHFLPRMLEMLAEGAEIHHSIELSLDRLGRCPEGSWNDEEKKVLNRFASAYFDCVLHDGPLGEGIHQWLDDPLSVLLMFDIGRLSIEPLLDLWLHCNAPASTVQFVVATYWNFWERQEYGNAFASDRSAFQAQLRDWILNPEHRKHFAGKLLSSDFQKVAQLQAPVGYISFSMMVDGVFDRLVQ